jgi:hypothetical protein
MRDAPADRWREPALEVYAIAHATEDPERAIAIASRLIDPERRRYAEVKIVVAWFARDPEGAGAWLEASSFEAEAQQKIRERLAMNERRRQKRAAREEARALRAQRAAGER